MGLWKNFTANLEMVREGMKILEEKCPTGLNIRPSGIIKPPPPPQPPVLPYPAVPPPMPQSLYDKTIDCIMKNLKFDIAEQVRRGNFSVAFELSNGSPGEVVVEKYLLENGCTFDRRRNYYQIRWDTAKPVEFIDRKTCEHRHVVSTGLASESYCDDCGETF